MEDINKWPPEKFVEEFGNVYEKGKWITVRIEKLRPFTDWESLEEAFTSEAKNLTDDEILKLLCDHPQLASKATMEKLSQLEQQGVGLNLISDTKAHWMSNYNEAYYQKFGFPFIVCVKFEKNADSIIEKMEKRINNSVEQEKKTALEQVQLIALVRLRNLKETILLSEDEYCSARARSSKLNQFLLS